MGIEFGRISGPLLARNLDRDGTDLAFETDLLYLSVVDPLAPLKTVGLGIRTDAPNRTLTINGTTRASDLIVSTLLETTNRFSISTNRVQNLYNDNIYIQPDQLSDPSIALPRIGTRSYNTNTNYLNVSNLLIENILTNSNIILQANGDGRVVITTDTVNIDGDLYATGDITWDGEIIFGDTDSDNVSLSADVDSDIIPDDTDTYNLGSLTQQWNKLYSKTLTADSLTVGEFTVNNIDLLLTQGNTLYVSVNGNDIYSGDHAHNTFRTVKHALSQAAAGDTVIIFPGTYEEIFPLVVPAGVTVNGAGIRSVTIQPILATNGNNAFLLNGETTVSNLSITNFYSGYAFSFSPGFTVTTRSPYIQNISVITAGVDAGNGALVDGSLANSASREASMLFHSVTFIVPNATGISATNGARVEWLNSFSYFAERGIYLTQGTLGFASQGVRFGAEMRSIGSANVYGTYGAVADGADTLAYLIGHNFAYIGVGTDTTNDPKQVLQANEVLESNNGRIYYDSVDQVGDFRIGDIFYVNQQSGAVVFNAQSISFSPSGSITLNGPTSSAYIDYSVVQVGNIQIYNNNIDSLIGPINLLANSGNTYLNTNVTVSGIVDITADISVDGSLFMGNSTLDTVTILPKLTQNLLPDDTGGPFALGSDAKRWNTLHAALFDVDAVIEIANNTVAAVAVNTDLIFKADGVGKIQISSTDVQIDDSLTVGNTVTVTGSTDFVNTVIVGTTTVTGDFNQTGSSNAYVTGTFANNNIKITGTSYVAVPDIKIFNNEISATLADSNLVFTANGTGGVVVDQQLKFNNNTISNVRVSAANDSQRSIIFDPNGTGMVQINSNRSLVLPVGSNAVRSMGIGEIRYNNVTNLMEGGAAALGLISFNGVYDSDRNTSIRAGASDNTLYFGTNALDTTTLNSTTLLSTQYQVDNVRLTSNTVSNSVIDRNLIFAPNGTGSTVLNAVVVNQNSIPTNLNTPLTLLSTGVGYVKFAGDSALKIPLGDDASRPTTPVLAMTRYNTERGYTEVFSGDLFSGYDGWIPAIGTSGEISAADVEQILEVWTYILG